MHRFSPPSPLFVSFSLSFSPVNNKNDATCLSFSLTHSLSLFRLLQALNEANTNAYVHWQTHSSQLIIHHSHFAFWYLINISRSSRPFFSPFSPALSVSVCVSSLAHTRHSLRLRVPSQWTICYGGSSSPLSLWHLSVSDKIVSDQQSLWLLCASCRCTHSRFTYSVLIGVIEWASEIE